MDLFNKSFNTTFTGMGDHDDFSPHSVGHTLYNTEDRKFQNTKILKDLHYNNQKN
jgi:hypothetical protein